MAQRTGSRRRKTRSKLKKHFKDKGKISIREYLKELKPGDKVLLKAEPAIQKGMYHPRFHGKIGIVKEKQGDCYLVAIKDKNMAKTQIVHPVHLKNA